MNEHMGTSMSLTFLVSISLVFLFNVKFTSSEI